MLTARNLLARLTRIRSRPVVGKRPAKATSLTREASLAVMLNWNHRNSIAQQGERGKRLWQAEPLLSLGFST